MQKPALYSLLITVLLFTAGALYAGDTAILDIKPPARGPEKAAEEPDLHEGKFDGYGVIERITPQEIVISDTHYRLSSGAAYKYLDGRLTNVNDFPVGTWVWFVLYADNIIESVWKEGG